MFQYSPTAALADDYERKLLNGVLGIQKPMYGTMPTFVLVSSLLSYFLLFVLPSFKIGLKIELKH